MGGVGGGSPRTKKTEPRFQLLKKMFPAETGGMNSIDLIECVM